MPISATRSALSHWHTVTHPIPPDDRAVFTTTTQNRQAFADWVQLQYLTQHTVVTRRATTRYLRDIGVFRPGQRWVKATTPMVTHLFGALCTFYLQTADKVTVDELVQRLRSYREPQDPVRPVAPIPDSIPDYVPPSLIVPDLARSAELTPAELRLALRDAQRTKRLEFAQYVLSRRGACSPKLVFRRWLGTDQQFIDTGVASTGAKPYQRTYDLAYDHLGQAAATLITTTRRIGRRDLAERLNRM